MIGADYRGRGKCVFTVWAPLLEDVKLVLTDSQQAPAPMQRDDMGYWRTECSDIQPGARYQYWLNNEIKRSDPTSFFQPDGVHEPSAVVDHGEYKWQVDQWRSVPPAEMIIYELHVGSFTESGTFEGLIERLPVLKDLGVNAIELMPVAQFPGTRNWGYDGVYPFAVQNSYGGPHGFKKLVDACHREGISVVLDVVYNHLGPEGNYLHDYAPYFTDKYHTPWGKAVNLDDAWSYGVRDYFRQNALYWFNHFRIDALRLDAVHAYFDLSAKPFLLELAEATQQFCVQNDRQCFLIAESDLNDTKIIRPPETGGCGLHAQWSDDFHHSVHSLLTGESDGYYEDFGSMEHLRRVLEKGYTYTGGFSVHRKRIHGNDPSTCPADQFVFCTQNHDQIGNRAFGERLITLTDFESAKLAAGILLLSPYTPLLFMGQEHGETNPFRYFVSHTDPELVEAVRQGRKAEFASFAWQEEPPDPQSEEAFNRSRPDWQKQTQAQHKDLLELYRELIRVRKQHPALRGRAKDTFQVEVLEKEKVLTLHRWWEDHAVFMIFHFAPRPAWVQITPPPGTWKKTLNSADLEWNGSGFRMPETINGQQTIEIQPHIFAVYEKEK